jgi:hypothetical protein
MKHALKNLGADLSQASPDSRARGALMAASAEFATNLVDVNTVIL